ncbi:hypothetical protein [Flagellimonas iocasae]|uniref:Uncharacterized protein n=1 Tax=Flagellimonas iocasae TaxID=2055905 RepID=A0ABW4Y013_9FLAO
MPNVSLFLQTVHGTVHVFDMKRVLTILLLMNHSYGFESDFFPMAKEEKIEKPFEPERVKLRINRPPILSDGDALDYLLKNVFGSKGNQNNPKGFSSHNLDVLYRLFKLWSQLL